MSVRSVILICRSIIIIYSIEVPMMYLVSVSSVSLTAAHWMDCCKKKTDVLKSTSEPTIVLSFKYHNGQNCRKYHNG